mmetsp:Transcript_40527/g.72534  ORF Transcript_40527/g.72534 Transcript_40527/m.72534 type:complete len:129 (+) Transcript_40527:821-1207(+)
MGSCTQDRQFVCQVLHIIQPCMIAANSCILVVGFRCMCFGLSETGQCEPIPCTHVRQVGLQLHLPTTNCFCLPQFAILILIELHLALWSPGSLSMHTPRYDMHTHRPTFSEDAKYDHSISAFKQRSNN